MGWQLEVAATFVHAGVATLPAATAGRVIRAARLAVDEQAMVDRLPSVVEKIIRDIPRLADAAAIVAALDHTWTSDRERVPVGARILRLAIDAAAVELSGMDRSRG